MEDDLTSISLVKVILAIKKNDKIVVASSNQGILYLFKWDWFGDCSDRMIVGELSIDTSVKIGDNKLLLGCEDGMVRTVSIHPNTVLKETVLSPDSGNDFESFGITRLVSSWNSQIIAGITFKSIT